MAQKIGTETTTYVRNIYKFYVAYKLTLEAGAEAKRTRRSVEELIVDSGQLARSKP